MNSKAILVSGGSKGLGLHIVQHLLDSGHAVSTFARRKTPAVEELAEKFSDHFEFIEADATDLPRIQSLADRLEEKTGAIHGLINNAALGQDHLLVHTDPAMIQQILAVNIQAPVLLTRIILKKMLLQEEGGRIVNISSICGQKGFTGLTVYSATKGAMDAFTRSLAQEVSSRGVLVNSIAPGFFESEMSAVLSQDQLATIKRRTPTCTLTKDHQILPILDMLLFSDTNITGQTIAIDGGASI
jgi:3-oxoacyl-[acyl-carrier protein] reductase